MIELNGSWRMEVLHVFLESCLVYCFGGLSGRRQGFVISYPLRHNLLGLDTRPPKGASTPAIVVVADSFLSRALAAFASREGGDGGGVGGGSGGVVWCAVCLLCRDLIPQRVCIIAR